MITPANINTALRLLAQWPDINAARIAKDRKPLRNWMRKAKPLAGFASSHRPTCGIVVYMLKKYTDKAQAEALPPPPEVITVIIRSGRSAEIATATTAANRSASRSSVATTADALRQYEAEVREKVKRHAAFVGVDEEAQRLLLVAAHLREAAYLIDTHATPDQDNG